MNIMATHLSDLPFQFYSNRGQNTEFNPFSTIGIVAVAHDDQCFTVFLLISLGAARAGTLIFDRLRCVGGGAGEASWDGQGDLRLLVCCLLSTAGEVGFASLS